jgi:hypothetical protein
VSPVLPVDELTLVLEAPTVVLPLEGMLVVELAPGPDVAAAELPLVLVVALVEPLLVPEPVPVEVLLEQ